MIKKAFVAIIVVFGASLIADEVLPSQQDSFSQELLALHWKTAGTYKLPVSHSSLAVPEDRLVLTGDDAKKLHSLIGNGDNPLLEAVTVSADSKDAVYFESVDDGYVSLSDWEEVDAKQMLSSISQNTERANKALREKGLPEVHVVGWSQEPTLDKTTNTVFWAIEGSTEGLEEHIFNSVALRLGRTGYEKLTWVGDMSRYKAFGGELDLMLRAHSFDPGYRYSDHTESDKVAGYGIAALVAATVGAKVVKATGLLLLFKKFWIFLVAGLAAFIKKLRKKKTDTDSE